MGTNFKWDVKTTTILIGIKHSNSYNQKYESAEGNPKLLQKVWDEIAKKVDESLTGKEAKVKYNSLYAVYKKNLDAIKVSGSEGVLWKYWSIFHETAPKKIKNTLMNCVQEIGDGIIPEEYPNNEILDVTQKILPVRNKNKVRKIDLINDMKMEYLSKGIEVMGNQITKSKGDEIIENRLDSLEKKVNLEFTELNKKLELLLQLSKNNRNYE